MQEMMGKWLDWPPVWAGLALVVIWVIGLLPQLIGFGGLAPGLSLASLGLGLWLIVSAVRAMRRAATTLNPRGQPSALVTEGVFGISRNPIYLGDACLLAAAAFYWDSVLALGVVAAFVWVVNDRFIPQEEDRLADAFGDAAAAWFGKVRRWI